MKDILSWLDQRFPGAEWQIASSHNVVLVTGDGSRCNRTGVKVPRSPDHLKSILWEGELRSRLARRPIAARFVPQTRCMPGLGGFTWNWISGDHLPGNWLNDPQRMAAVAATLRLVHAELSALRRTAQIQFPQKIPGAWDLSNRLLTAVQSAPEYGSLHKKLLDVWRLRPGLEKRWKQQEPCHGDFHAENIILSGSHVFILDWEFASLGDPLVDLGMLLGEAFANAGKADLTRWRQEHDAQLRDFVRAYGKSDGAACDVVAAHAAFEVALRACRSRGHERAHQLEVANSLAIKSRLAG